MPDKHQMIQLNKMPSYQRTNVILGRVRHAENAAKRFLQLLSKISTSLSPFAFAKVIMWQRVGSKLS